MSIKKHIKEDYSKTEVSVGLTIRIILYSLITIVFLSAKHWLEKDTFLHSYLIGPYGIYSVFWLICLFMFIWVIEISIKKFKKRK
jgi:uncharacterized membrane protein